MTRTTAVSRPRFRRITHSRLTSEVWTQGHVIDVDERSRVGTTGDSQVDSQQGKLQRHSTDSPTCQLIEFRTLQHRMTSNGHASFGLQIRWRMWQHNLGGFDSRPLPPHRLRRHPLPSLAKSPQRSLEALRRRTLKNAILPAGLPPYCGFTPNRTSRKPLPERPPWDRKGPP